MCLFGLFSRSLAAVALTGVLAGSALAEMVYHRGNAGDPETLDPHRHSLRLETHILNDLYEGLTTYDAGGQIIPGVAERWDISEDGTVYRFYFRDDAKWSNGEPVTASDFVFSLRRIADPATAAKYISVLYPIKNVRDINSGKLALSMLGVKAIDDRTLEITLEAPTPYLLELLANPAAMPVYPPGVRQYGDDFVKPGHMVSNGAYMLEDSVPNAETTLVRNPYFHDAENVAIDKVVFYPIDDQSAALRRFVAGELDSNYGAPLEQAKWMRENIGDQLRIFPWLSIYYYAVNTAKPPFDDQRVRQALSMAIDRKFLSQKIWNGAMIPGYSFVPPGIPNYGEPVMLDYKDQPMSDRERAAIALLEQAGYGPDHPLKVTLRYNTDENHKNTAVAIADMWKTINVETTLINADIATHYAILKNRDDFDIARASWSTDYADAQGFLFLLQSSNTGLNFSRYANPAFDVLMDEAAKIADPEKRRAMLHQAEAMIERDEPNLSLLYYSSQNLVSDALKGWRDNVIDTHLSRWMSIAR